MKKKLKECTSPEERWEKGIGHDSRSEAILRAMNKVDAHYGWHCCDAIEVGGDGDTGESLMYLLDIAFEAGLLGRCEDE